MQLFPEEVCQGEDTKCVGRVRGSFVHKVSIRAIEFFKAVSGKPGFLRGGISGCKEGLEHGTKACKWVSCDWDKYHDFVKEFANNIVSFDGWCGGSYQFVDVPKFVMFMHLKMVVYIGSDGLDYVFRCVTFWGGCCSCDGDICANCCVGAAVVGGGVLVE